MIQKLFLILNMQFKYKLKSKWYSADIPKEDYEDFLNMTFADKMKYIKKLEPKEKEDDSKTDLGYSILGTRREKLKNETVEQMQDKEEKRLLAKRKMEELKDTEKEITKITNDIEQNPDGDSDNSKELFKQLEELLEKKDTLAQQIQTLNVDNIKLMNVQQVDTLNIKGINKLVSDLNKNNITEKLDEVKKEVAEVYKQTLSDTMLKNMQKILSNYEDNITKLINSDRFKEFNEQEARLFSTIVSLSKLFNENYSPKPIYPFYYKGEFLFPFYTYEDRQMAPCFSLNTLLNYSSNSKKLSSLLKIMEWRNLKDKSVKYTKVGETTKLGNKRINEDEEETISDRDKKLEITSVEDSFFIIPVDEDNSDLYETLEGIANKLKKQNQENNLKMFLNYLTKIKNAWDMLYVLHEKQLTEDKHYRDYERMQKKWDEIYDNIKYYIEDEIKDLQRQKRNEPEEEQPEEKAEGIISDIKNAPKKIKQLETKIDNLEQLIKDLIKKEPNPIPEPVKEIPKPVETKTNDFTIPKLKHVETNANKTNTDTDFKELKDILERRRQDIEYSDDEDESTDWEDNYTELTAGSLQDATDLIESLRDNYNIVLRMYINKKNFNKK